MASTQGEPTESPTAPVEMQDPVEIELLDDHEGDQSRLRESMCGTAESVGRRGFEIMVCMKAMLVSNHRTVARHNQKHQRHEQYNA